MDEAKKKKPNNPECYTPLSEPFKSTHWDLF
jgi:hypothetical protein